MRKKIIKTKKVKLIIQEDEKGLGLIIDVYPPDSDEIFNTFTLGYDDLIIG